MQIRKYLPAMALALAATTCVCLAQGTSSTPPATFDLTALDTAASQMGNGLYALFVDTLLPNVINVLKGVAILVGLLLLWRWIRRGIGR